MNKLKKVRVKTIEKSEEKIYNNIFEYAKMTLDLEEKREQSLISQSNRMLTAFSITTGILLLVYQLAQKSKAVSTSFLNAITIICMLLFVVSMVLAILVSWRYKYRSLDSPLTMMNHVLANKQYFETQEQRDKSFTQTINEVWESKHKLNDKRAHLIKASMSVYFISLAIAVCSVLFVLIKIIL